MKKRPRRANERPEKEIPPLPRAFLSRQLQAQQKHEIDRLRKLRDKGSAAAAFEIMNDWRDFAVDRHPLFDSARVEIPNPPPSSALLLLLHLARGDSGVFRALADYIDEFKFNPRLVLTEQLFDYACHECVGKPIHTAREIKNRFAPHDAMRSDEWVRFLRDRNVPFLPGRRGRPRKQRK
jgi:hypothetical protein